MRRHLSIASVIIGFGMICSLSAQQAAPAQGRQGGGGTGAARASAASLFFDVNWVRPPSQTGQTKLVQENIGDANLELKQYRSARELSVDVRQPRQRNDAVQRVVG